MKSTALFIQRPVMTTLVMAGILVFGVMAFRNLPVSDLPNVDFPTVEVSASLPGADPDTMASSVATPLEREFSLIAGVEAMSSVSMQGSTRITLTFDMARDIDAAAQDVQAAIARAERRLPRDMPNPPSYQKVNPADQPILYLALMSDTMPTYQLHEYAETMLAQRISMVSGVAQVQIYGAQKYAVRVQVDPQKLAARGIGIDEVVGAIQQANVNMPTGILHGPHKAFTVEASGQLLNARAYESVIVAHRNGNPVRLNEVGRVIDSVEDDKTIAWFKAPGTKELKRSIVLAIQRQPGANTVEVVDRVNKLLETIRLQIPPSVQIELHIDRSKSIRESIEDVEFTLVLTLALVVLVIFLFLRKLRATIIPSIAIPMSIIGTFAVMYLLDYNLDNLSLMALTLSIGFVVDDAIVVLENIVRKMEHGLPPMQAALEGTSEIGFTVLSMTLSLAAVFIPVLFMPGLMGRLLTEFAVTIGVAILVSGVVSLTLTPMMSSRFLRPPEEQRYGLLYRASEKVFDGMLWVYEVTLRWVFRHRLFTMGVSAMVLVATFYLFKKIPQGFLPLEDIGQIFAQTEALEGTSFEAMVEHQLQAARIIAEDPNVEAFMCNAGARGSRASNTGSLSIRLKPRDQREMTAEEVIQSLRPKLAEVPGLQTFLQIPPPIRLGGRLTKGLYQFTLQCPDTEELYKYAPLLMEKMRELPGLQDVTSDMQLNNPQVNVEIDRDKASTLGISAEQVELALSCAYGTRQISTMYTPTNQFYVILEVLPEHRRHPGVLPLLYLRSSSGQLVPLESLARIERTVGPLLVNHTGQLPSVTLSFNLAPGHALGTATDDVTRLAREILPATISTSFQGQAQAFQSSQRGMLALLIVSVLVIYLVLGILYESFIHPITILTALPFAGVGALATLMYFGLDLNIYGFVGVIMLIGLVKKNGIMMIDFAIEARRTGLSPRDAMYQACVVRFRPIMMTTMAALVGTLPIALGYGAGAESRRPLGLAVVGGLLFSQSLTLYVTPVFYLYAERMVELLSKLRKSRSDSALTIPVPEPIEPQASETPVRPRRVPESV
ncbi:MAG TPA: efflux RND transporter permease subunit [Phycisphaerae bacterium]|nr:efflux RND transporter permease subunit [Phycisphaerae bacterium]HOB75800.1 efflux RND transporter permease subunit [Phycisphaerae bacterium]HOJ55568.1 efflux RND transporter permease subunit [Phycisphaerae bacterium]HOL27736.1 efflux RND transporter permease subunit [Phycisphaerae bacterium]HPP21882.1 efflux RND transporter permease subunit [Phycisphaerae bacterium]